LSAYIEYTNSGLGSTESDFEVCAAIEEQAYQGDIVAVGLEPGETRFVDIDLGALPEGVYDLWLTVDCSDIIDESDESNNSFGPVVITVEESTAAP